MATQRIVIASPWKLGLFVFLLVLGTGFGLIYAYLELFGGSIDLQDEKQLNNAYIVLGCVAGLGLMGYLAVVTSARPLERVVRGSRRRDKLIKRCGGIEDPRQVDLSEFEDETAIRALLERWSRDANAASHAQLLVASQRESITSLIAQLRSAEPELSLSDDELTPDLGALIAAIQDYGRSETTDFDAVHSGHENWSAEQEEVLAAAADLARSENELLEFVTSVAEGAQSLSSRTLELASGTDGHDAASPAAYESARRGTERMSDIRQKLEMLAEESNKLAITMALQLSRVGDAGSEMLETTEELRALSSRYQQTAEELRSVETEQANAIERLGQGASTSGLDSSSLAALQQQAMILDQNAEALRELLGRWHGPMTALRNWASEPQDSASQTPVADAFAPGDDDMEPSTSVEPMTTSDEDDIYEIADLGGREIAAGASAGADKVYDLDQFGAVEL